jgi:hypothetical protein
MFLIASYPRSGNHLLRFFIEYLTERPTLGCRGNVKDTPIHLNKFAEPDILAHVQGAPIGQKVHDNYAVRAIVTEGNVEGGILILRDPIEAVLSHAGRRRRRPVSLAYLWHLHRLNRGLVHYLDLAHEIERMPYPLLVLSYECLISEDEQIFLSELDRLTGFLGGYVDTDRKAALRSDFRRVRSLNASVEGRDWAGIRSAFDPTFYTDRCEPLTLRFLHWRLRARSGDARPVSPERGHTPTLRTTEHIRSLNPLELPERGELS